MKMAIVANKRKRKHQQLENGTEKDEGLHIIPAKKPAKSKDIKQSTDNSNFININNNSSNVQENSNAEVEDLINNEENGVNTEKDEEQENANALETSVATKLESNEKSMKFSNNFKMLDFRAKLRGNDFITELKHFLHLAEKRPQIIVKYIEKRGKPLELVEALERVDKTNITHVCHICEALQLVLMEIVANHNEHLQSAVYGCRYLLKVHAQIVDLLLNSTEFKHRKIALKLLTAIVCVDAQLGRRILATFNVLTNMKSIQKLLTHSVMELKHEIDKIEDGNVIVWKKQHYDGETVRKCFIHFVLSYLIDGNALLIRNILDYTAVIKSLIDGLVFDEALTVCMVLTTLKKFVVENTDISKTKKIHVFDVNCCKALIKLYDWCGPSVYLMKVCNGTAKSSGSKLNKSVGLLDETITNGTDTSKPNESFNNDSKEHDMVSKVVHEFLLVLLTSRKNGIAFDTNKHHRQKRNTIQGQIVGSITKPWSSPLKTELLCKILEACPDLYRHTVRHYAGMINPVRCGQKFYVSVADFLRQIINSCHPKCLKGAIETKITLTDFSYWIKDICLPLESLVHITGSKLLHHRDFNVRVTTTRLLLAMFQQYTNYINLLRQQQLQKQQQGQQPHQSKVATNDIRKFKFDMLNHLLMHFPTVEAILTSLNMSMEYKHSEGVNIFTHMDVTLDLLLLICQENPTFVSKTTIILDYLELLRPVYANEDNHNIRLEMKAIKTILILSPKVLEPNREQFAKILESFVKAYVYGEADIRREAGNLLHYIFKNTGIFDSGELEIDLWLQSLHFFSDNPDTIDVICQIFNEVLKVTEAPVEMPATDMETIANVKKLHKLFEHIENSASAIYGGGSAGDAEVLTISKLMPLIYKGVEIVKPLADYLECVCLLMFHYYHKPEYILKLYEMEFKQFSSYMTSWIDKNNIMKYEENLKELKKFQLNIPKWVDINKYIFDTANNEMNILENFFGNEKPIDIKEKQNLEMDIAAFMPNEQLLMIYIQLILFQVVQLKQKHQLMGWQAEKAAKFINECLICISKQSFSNNMTCLKSYPSHFKQIKCNEEQTEADPLYESFLQLLLKYIFSMRLQEVDYEELLIGANDENHYPKSETSLAFLKFLKLLIHGCNDLDTNIVNFEVISVSYKTKLVKMMTKSIGNVDEMNKCKKFSIELKEFLEVLSAFQLNGEQCLEILNHLSDHLTYKDYFMDNDNNTMEYSFYYHLLAFCLERIAATQTAVKCDQFVRKFQKVYQQFYKKFPHQDLSIENLEESFHKFLKTNHHYVEKTTKSFFECFLLPDRKLFKSSIKLCCFIYKHSNQNTTELNEAIVNYLNIDNIDRKELLYPLLDIAFEKNLDCAKFSITQGNCKKLYETFKNGFMRLIEKPQKSGQIYKESVKPAIKLIELCMPISECKDFCMKQLKFDSVELGQIKLIQCIYMKAFNGCESNESKKKLDIFINYVLLICNMFSLDIKTQKLSIEKCELLAFFIQQWFNELGDNDNTDSAEKLNFTNDFTKIIQSNQWFQFCRAIIKKGMEDIGDEQTKEGNAPGKLQGLILKILAYLIDHIYMDDNNRDSGDCVNGQEKYNELGQLFELIFQHSKFYDIILQQQQQHLHHNEYYDIEQKQQLIYLLYVLAKKYPNALKQEQIPIILGAYQARLSITDRYCLALLNLYDNYGRSLEKYKPFLWGEGAISFYNLNTQVADDNNEKGDHLNYTEITINQIMLLVDKQICDYTLENYPVWRKLQTLEQMPEIEFENPAKSALRFGSNDLERKIETGIGELGEDTDLRLCPKRYGIYEKCYDPAFFIPLMSMLFAPDSYCHPARPVQNGLLSITIAALSSQDKQMRLAAGCIQSRYREHFEQSHFFEKPLWIQMYDNIQAGLEDLRQNAIKWKGKNNIPRIPLISSLFIAKTFNLTTEPTHLLYKQLTLHMRLKNVFDFQTIPDFNVLFYSSEVEHLEYRRFILQLICNSLKCSADLFQLISTNTFKVLMACYGSGNNMTTLDINLLILSIFSTCVKIPASVKLMIENVGIMSWLNCLINNIEFYQFDIIDGVITILSNLWYSLKAAETEFHNFSFLQKQLHQLIVKILPKLSARIKVAYFCKLMHILNKTSAVAVTITVTTMAANDTNNIMEYELVSKEQMKHLLTCAEKHFGTTLIKPLFNIYEMGGTCCPSAEDYCHQLYNDSKLDVKYIVGLNSLRSYLIKWWSVNHRNC